MAKEPFPVDRLIGNRIRVLRKLRQLSVEQVSENLAISKRLLREKETGKKRFSAQEILTLAEIFQVQPSSFFKNLSKPEAALPVKTTSDTIYLSDYKKFRTKLSPTPKLPNKPRDRS